MAKSRRAVPEKYQVGPVTGFTAAQRSAVRRHVGLLQRTLRLQAWSIEVDFDSAAPDALADMTAAPHQKWATLRLGEGFVALPAKVRSQTLVHEMLHCHLFELHQTVSDVLLATTGRKARAVAEAAVEGQVELATDALADVLVGLIPPLELPQA